MAHFYKNPNLGRLSSFKKKCENSDIEILHDDLVFINKKLDNFSRSDFKSILEGYLNQWSIGMSSSGSAIKSQGEGRKRANLWLLEKSDQNLIKENPAWIY